MLLSSHAPRALLVEDNPADARLVRELLCEGEDGFVLTVANRLSAALELLAEEHFAVVLVDLGLPDAERLEVLDALRSRVGSTPVVVYSGAADDGLAAAARALGVSDVLRKGALDGAALNATLRMIVEAAAFSDAVRERLREARLVGQHVAVIRLLVERPADGGPASADAALAPLVGERLAGRLCRDDGLFPLGEGRYGVVAAVADADGAEALARELCSAFERPLGVGGGRLALAVQAGHAFAPGGTGTAEALLERASVALREGGPVAPPEAPAAAPLRDHANAAPSFAARLRHAIRTGELVLHYQPIVRVSDDAVPLVEALVRWHDPVRGMLNPGSFIPLAEESSLIEEIGSWALMEACRQLRAWDDAGLPAVRCAVNLSARELCSSALPARVADALALSGVGADRLEIELTESMFADLETTAQVIARLRAIGMRVAIDDFGTGYSSLAYLSRFAVDTIKVDGAFVRRATQDEDAAAVVHAIVGIAHQLRLEVVAEGVETLEQLAFAGEHGCDLIQGWLFARPMTGDGTAAWLRWAQDRVACSADRPSEHQPRRALRAREPSPLDPPRRSLLLADGAQLEPVTSAGG